MPNAHPDLWQRYQATKAASTAKYARDIAAEMGISERSEEHTSEPQSHYSLSYAVFCLKKKNPTL